MLLGSKLLLAIVLAITLLSGTAAPVFAGGGADEAEKGKPQQSTGGRHGTGPGARQPGDPLWYKDAIIYELPVKSFYDSDGDGYGDFRGLTAKLDYVQRLGINCIWLLPFYPSPLKDDGYDVSDYRGVHRLYGSFADFSHFIDEAHRRGIRVITDLVINHTSDQHPWFQSARKAPPGSPQRDFYVWSNTDRKYKGARIIFTDSEKSNWAWDPIAHAYYWHRFFRCQPDLNYDNPRVLKAITDVMRFWFDHGVDGVRLDAAPYLIEREGTSCENLPATHQILKEIRQLEDKQYGNRIFLAESNQWAPDLLKYFGDGDECQMAYNFPLMPRIFIAIGKEDRQPIIDQLRRTSGIPAGSQWGLFLRNHDELTLEMVTPSEREYLYKTYAPDPMMRLNVGIRRRLAPLLGYDRAGIELLNSLLLSLPGTPIIYYGDELGMGDNIRLNDRNGVRTPMQWTGGRNGGFSSAVADKLYSPPVSGSPGGYEKANVEAEKREPSSLLNWMASALKVRKQHPAFGRGSIEFLSPESSSVLAFIREYQGETILIVTNLSKRSQHVELDLSAYAGDTPLNLLGEESLRPITKEPFGLECGPQAYYWLLLRPR